MNKMFLVIATDPEDVENPLDHFVQAHTPAQALDLFEKCVKDNSWQIKRPLMIWEVPEVSEDPKVLRWSLDVKMG